MRFDESAILGRFDRSSPEALLKSIVSEFARLHEANRTLLARVSAMEALQSFADRIAPADEPASGAPYPGRVRIDADQSFADSHGFHHLEHDPLGKPFRWTGPERQFSFHFFIDRRTPAHFTLTFDEFFVASTETEFGCLVDGTPVGLSLKRFAAHWEASGVMAPRKDSGGSALMFVCARTESPEALGLPDPRRLGVSFRSLSVETEAAAAGPSAQRSHVRS